MADSKRLRGWKWDGPNAYLEVWVDGTSVAVFDDSAPYLTVASGVTLTAGDLTLTAGGLVISTGGATIASGLTVTAGGATITAGGLTVTAGGIDVNGGLVFFNTAQVIDMADSNVTLTIDTSGTQVTSNLLAVDPNTASTSENLLMPPESESTGLALFIINTGGESIVIQTDSGGNITPATTIATTGIGICVCDGTTWYGNNAE